MKPSHQRNAIIALGLLICLAIIGFTQFKQRPQQAQALVASVDWASYAWDIKTRPSNMWNDQVGLTNSAPVDPTGGLQLKVRKSRTTATSSELSLSRSLGYGTYTLFVKGNPDADKDVVEAMALGDRSPGFNMARALEVTRWSETIGPTDEPIDQNISVGMNSLDVQMYRIVWSPSGVRYIKQIGGKAQAWTYDATSFKPGQEKLSIIVWASTTKTSDNAEDIHRTNLLGFTFTPLQTLN